MNGPLRDGQLSTVLPAHDSLLLKITECGAFQIVPGVVKQENVMDGGSRALTQFYDTRVIRTMTAAGCTACENANNE